MDGVQRIEAGDLEVWCIEDGTFTFPRDVFPDLDEGSIAARLSAVGLTAIETAFSAYVIRYPDGRTDLVDTGCGTLMGPGAGLLADRLARLGVGPETVSRVILTHLHGDHCGGAILGGRLVYRGARHVLQQAEIDHFAGTETPGAQFLKLAEGLIDPIDGDADLGDGVTAWSLPGHTPGHMGVRLGDELALVGDILHSAALQLTQPDLCSIHDMDPGQARTSRQLALEHVAEAGIVVSGSHFIGPDKFVRIQRDGAGGIGFAPL